MSEYAARYNDGRTATTRDIRLVVTGGGLDLRADDGTAIDHWPGAALRLVDGRKGSGPIRLANRDNDLARLTLDDRGALDGLISAFPNITRSHRPDRRTVSRALVWGAAAAGGVALFVFVLIPQFAGLLAHSLPEPVERRIGARVADQLTRMLAVRARKPAARMRCDDPAGMAALAALTGRLAGTGGAPAYLVVRVVDSPMVNAFALPGGHILIPRGMIEFAASAEALAGVLGHEMAHIAMRHPTKTMLETAGISLLFSLMVGDVAGGAVIVAVGERLIRGSYSRAAERDSDSFARARLSEAGIDARPLASMFDRLLERDGDPSGVFQMISSHPPSRERADAIRASATTRGSALSKRQWRALKSICKKSAIAP